ncbi:hypothetical protein WA1_30160 [Scytonema hofmannii PCC 7110]|uniref:CopG family transcriptional regulator n=1 Tax=Scytonema hofmannii PCC 7110 TaxID=128403 RepID=A0A139X4J9_9CYAN|nr:hypothetical protein [Scytonema hofmannii]KYC39610.1 hypothetical protein WA1_30160 [Scytonema hofmannii PCC 7110]
MSKRKPLDNNEDLAKDFVFESSQSPTPDKKPKSKTTIESKNKTGSMSEKFKVAPKEPTVRLTVDLTETQHRKLSILAAKNGRKKAEIVRMLLDEALADIDD